MRKIIAVVFAVVLLLACTAAPAESGKESLGVLRVQKSFDIQYKTLPDDYSLTVYLQDDMMIFANIESSRTSLPRMGLVIAYNDQWAETERLNDLSEEEMQVIRNSFAEEYGNLEFEIKETKYGTNLLVVEAPSKLDAYVYTIYKGHEIEIHLFPGADQEALTDADIDRVVAFLSDMDFVPVEE